MLWVSLSCRTAQQYIGMQVAIGSTLTLTLAVQWHYRTRLDLSSKTPDTLSTTYRRHLSCLQLALHCLNFETFTKYCTAVPLLVPPLSLQDSSQLGVQVMRVR